MQNLLRSREQPDPRSFAARKGHLPQLSISDDNHHVTEAIGYMYGDDDSPSSPQSPARHSVRSNKSLEAEMDIIGQRKAMSRKPIPDHRTSNGDRVPSLMHPSSLSPLNRQNGWEDQQGSSPVSPLSARESSPSETANTHFPLNDIDYESSPAAVAQELSNLQALRRMSMDVGAAGDPDLPQLNAAAMPKAPSSTASEDDSARLFWVPARLHPELAPKEFKSFLESKAEQIKRRSGELSAFSSSNASRSSSLSSNESSSGLRRKKSMLSRQIDSPVDYQDGAERLNRKKSQEQDGHPTDPNLEELESLVSGNSGLPRLSLEKKYDEETGDIILPAIPGSSLKRSTRTQYKRPSSRKGPTDQATYAERARRRAAAGTGSAEGNPPTPTVGLIADDPELPNFSTGASNLASTPKDPLTDLHGSTVNFSRPGHRSPSPPPKDASNQASANLSSVIFSREDTNRTNEAEKKKSLKRVPHPPATTMGSERPIPQIVESPPPEDHPVRTSSMAPPPSNVYSMRPEAPKPNEIASRDRPKITPASRPGMPPKQSGSIISSSRPSSRGSNMPPQTPPTQTLEQPSPLPGHDSNTSNLSFIPTLTVDKRQESKRKEEKKSGWGWLLGKEESDKDKDKSKGKGSKSSQSHDSTRLDVLQTSIDGGPKGRESLVLDRESLKLEEERKKESQRKSSGTERKEKEGLFSSIFGGKKHRAERDAQRKAQERLSPEPPYRELKPDIDYNWTRFSILEERAIYRMAHIKLANPRRALYSQVLLSNFMYSYLAKVQQMHPQMNLPTSAKQQRKQKEQQQLQQQQQQQQPDEYTQYQRYQEQQEQIAANAAATPGSPNSNRESHQGFDDDSNLYNYNYSRESQWSDARTNQHSVESTPLVGSEHYSGVSGSNNHTVGGAVGGSQYHQQPQQRSSQRQQQKAAPGYKYDDDDDDDMW